MEHIGNRLVWYFIPFTDIEIPMGGLNVLTVFNTLVVMAVLFFLCRLGVRRFALEPTRGQYMVELITGVFDNLVIASLELETKEKNRKFFFLIASLFLFLLLSNFMSFLPTHYFEEPTADINCTMGLGLMGMAIATYCAIKAKGGIGYVEELLGPLWHQEDATGGAAIAGKLSALFFFPLNIIGEIAKVISISFRLFGNITGGGIIIIVISHLVWNFSVLSIGMDLFFIFFVGTVQAFVFTMLTLTYISVAIK
ncbi:MAG: F0F1 ATP synthase subunit A [Candidatus Hydrogenedens sp.]|nr:F0F1 ATP synthase subunit A [Candidatus Hydrogenedens sp.]